MTPIFLAAAAAIAAPATPDGNWEAQVDERTCVASRAYAHPAYGKLALDLEPDLLGGYTTVRLLSLDGQPLDHSGDRHLPFYADGELADPHGYIMRHADGRQLVHYTLDQDNTPTVALPTSMSFRFENGEDVEIALPNAPALASVLSECLSDIRASINLPEASLVPYAVSPPPHIHEVFRPDDVPSKRSTRGELGAAKVIYVIEPNGRVDYCHIWQTSGVDSWDEKICKIIRNRYRGEPARDADGHAVPLAIMHDVAFGYGD